MHLSHHFCLATAAGLLRRGVKLSPLKLGLHYLLLLKLHLWAPIAFPNALRPPPHSKAFTLPSTLNYLRCYILSTHDVASAVTMHPESGWECGPDVDESGSVGSPAPAGASTE